MANLWKVEKDIDQTAYDSVLFVINQFLVAIKDGKFSYEELEKVGKLLYRLNGILKIYADKKGRENLTQEEFIKLLTSFVESAKEYYK